VIEFKKVDLAFGEHEVLKDLSFGIQFHEKAAVLGKSGSGKTSILRLILGLLKPDGGAVFVNGQDIIPLSESQLREPRQHFSIVFQDGALFDSMTVFENVAFCIRESSRLPEAELVSRVNDLLTRLDIEEAAGLMPEALSGGMKRRVAIARAWADCEPQMMLYDEPTTGLDPITANHTIDLINELSEGSLPERKGFIMVTHDVLHAAKAAERFLFLKQGRIAFDGDLEMLEQSSDPVLHSFVSELR
jgi:phospholipid/cholesterol/gamma-HCH transport system ATP-binding protein